MHTVLSVAVIVVKHRSIYYPSALFHWQLGNHTIAPAPLNNNNNNSNKNKESHDSTTNEDIITSNL